MNYKLSTKSIERLKGLHPVLSSIVMLAIKISDVDFSVIDGVRSKEKQAQYVKDGLSKTLDSYHLTGHAVDLYPWVDGKTSHDHFHYAQLNEAMQKAAKQLGYEVEWGGNWKSFVDKPHFQINRNVYK